MLEVTHWTLFLHTFRFKLYSVLIFDACMFFCVTNLHISKIFHKCSSILCNLGNSYDKILNSRFELSLLQQIAQSVFSIRCCYYCYRKKVGRDPEKNGLTGQMSVLGWYVRLSSEFMALECVRAM